VDIGPSVSFDREVGCAACAYRRARSKVSAQAALRAVDSNAKDGSDTGKPNHRFEHRVGNG
jgi:hypothetical protein